MGTENPLVQPSRNGVLCILIHGTFASSAKWTQPGSDLRTAIERLPGIHVDTFPWDANNNQKSRYLAALELAKTLNEVCEKYRHIFLVGHSHGGTVAVQAINFSDAANISLITLATPFVDIELLDAERNCAILLYLPVGIPYLLCALVLQNELFVPYFYHLTSLFIASLYFIVVPFIYVATYQYWLFPLSDALASRLRRIAKWYTGFTIRKPIDMLALSYKKDEVNRIFLTRSGAVKRSSFDSSRSNINLMTVGDNVIIKRTVIYAMTAAVILAIVWFFTNLIWFLLAASLIWIGIFIYMFIAIFVIVFQMNLFRVIRQKNAQDIFSTLWNMLVARAAFALVMNSGPRKGLSIIGGIIFMLSILGIIISVIAFWLVFGLAALSFGTAAGASAFSLGVCLGGLGAGIVGSGILFGLGILPVDALVVSVRSVGRPRSEAMTNRKICKKLFHRDSIPWWKHILQRKALLHNQLYQDKEVIEFIVERMSAGKVCV